MDEKKITFDFEGKAVYSIDSINFIINAIDQLTVTGISNNMLITDIVDTLHKEQIELNEIVQSLLNMEE